MVSYIPPKFQIICKECHKEIHGKNLQLVEIFEEYTPVIKGGSQYGRYQANYIIAKKKNPKIITESVLQEYLEKLKLKYGSEHFYIRKVIWKNKVLFVLDKLGNGRVPIYFDITNQKFYIDKKYLETQPKLTNYIIMVTLGSLGISQSKYANGLTR